MENRTFKIAGVKFRPPHVYELLKGLEKGSLFELEAEPDNKFDPNAVKIMYYDGESYIHVGYVPKVFSAEIAAALEIGPYAAIALDFSPDKKSYEFEVEVMPVVDALDAALEADLDDLDIEDEDEEDEEEGQKGYNEIEFEDEEGDETDED